MGFEEVTLPEDGEEEELFSTESEETPPCPRCGGESEEAAGYGLKCKASPDECEVITFVTTSYTTSSELLE